jgi:hypothetical protein
LRNCRRCLLNFHCNKWYRKRFFSKKIYKWNQPKKRVPGSEIKRMCPRISSQIPSRCHKTIRTGERPGRERNTIKQVLNAADIKNIFYSVALTFLNCTAKCCLFIWDLREFFLYSLFEIRFYVPEKFLLSILIRRSNFLKYF